MAEREIVVVGGGAIGLAAARALALDGNRVAVLERGAPAREATWAAGGMLAPLGEAPAAGPFLEAAVRSLERYPAFARAVGEASGVDVHLRTCGTLHVATTPGEEAALRRRFAWQRDAGFDVRWVEGAALRRLEPGLGPGPAAGLHLPTDAAVDPRRLGRALAGAAVAAGVRLSADVTVRGLRSEGGRVTGVHLASGKAVDADTVVLAAGAWSGRLEGLPGALPVRPVRGQMVAVDGPPGALAGVVVGRGAYLVPRVEPRGRVLVGATMEEVGFEEGTEPADIARLRGAAEDLLPALRGAPEAARWSGFRPGTPDDLPVVGSHAALAGLVYATGHFRNGILLAPLTAAWVADEVAGRGRVPAAFRPERFAGARGVRAPEPPL